MVEDCETSTGENGQRDKEFLEDKDSETHEIVVVGNYEYSSLLGKFTELGDDNNGPRQLQQSLPYG